MQLPRGVEEAVVGMEVGEARSIEVPPELGYGAYQDKLASWHLKGMVEHGYDLKAGDVVFWTNPDDGRRMPAWVTEETADMVKLDFNHPFAGKTLAYWVELVDLRVGQRALCYPCTRCGRCGKYREGSPFYVSPATIPCLACGGTVDPVSGRCPACGALAFAPERDPTSRGRKPRRR